MRKFKFSDPGAVMFTSDTHFGHANIIRFCDRPYGEANEMDEALIANWNRVVSKGQTVFHLGDFAFKGNQSRPAVISHRLNGNIVLIRGNHDNPHTQRLFNEVHDLAEVIVAGQRIILCHYAMRVWNGSFRGSWHLYGHSHGTLPGREGQKELDIGVDSWDYTPVRFDQIADAMGRITRE